jgi:F-type H+-transporting ATPase subunit delta
MDLGTAQASRIDGYAAALLDVAGAEAGEADIVGEIHAAATALGSNAELVEVLRDPQVPTERKQGIVDELIGGRATQVTTASINFLIAAGQAKHLGAIASRLTEMAADAEGEVVAEVRSPMDLDADQVERLRSALARATGKKVQIQVVIDPSVVGGVVTKVGDTVLDGSIHGRFTELREQWG